MIYFLNIFIEILDKHASIKQNIPERKIKGDL